MLLLFISFFSSLFLILGIIRYKHLHEHFSGDPDRSGPQKFHTNNNSIFWYGYLWIVAACRPMSWFAITTSGSSRVTASEVIWVLPHRILKTPESLGLDSSSMLKYKTPSSYTGLENESTKNCLSSERSALIDMINRHFKKASRSWRKNPS